MIWHTVVVAFGSNLVAPETQILQAAEILAQSDDFIDFKLSSLYRTAPVGYAEQPDFVNAVAVAKTRLSPEALLLCLQDLERQFGRVRTFQNAPRTLDLDIIDFNQENWKTDTLILPHPRAHERGFVMIPLAEIAPDYPIGKAGRARDLAQKLGGDDVKLIG